MYVYIIIILFNNGSHEMSEEHVSLLCGKEASRWCGILSRSLVEVNDGVY